MRIKIVRVDKTLPLPEYKTGGSVAFDLYVREEAVLGPNEMRLVPANFIIEVPAGYFLLLTARSSSAKKGIRLGNGVGTIDQDFHGAQDELKLALHNFSSVPVTVARGERIAQGVIIPIIKPEFEEVEIIKEESRGSFGSTGNF